MATLPTMANSPAAMRSWRRSSEKESSYGKSSSEERPRISIFSDQSDWTDWNGDSSRRRREGYIALQPHPGPPRRDATEGGRHGGKTRVVRRFSAVAIDLGGTGSRRRRALARISLL